MNRIELPGLIMKGESETLELKKSTSEMKEAVISIVSILNKHMRGELYFGIKNDSYIVGQSIGKDTLRDISKAIADNIEPKIYPEIQRIKINGKDCIHVKFEGTERPYFAYGRAYIRVADEDKRLAPKELERLFKERSMSQWENGFSERKVTEVNPKVIKDFVSKANAAKRVNFTSTNPKNVLNKLELLRNGKLLRAGEVLFCDRNTLEVQTAVFAGMEKLTFLDMQNFKGNLFSVFGQSEQYIKEHINWKAKLDDRTREEIPEIPLRAITEALVNSLCHRDYTTRKSNEIAIYKDRVDIYNPGEFPEEWKPEDFIRGEERSILRNPLIANTMYLAADIERWGSGLKRIWDECRDADVRVEFKRHKGGFSVVFYRNLEFEDTARKVTPKVTETPVERKAMKVTVKVTPRVTANQKKILDIIRKNPYATALEMAEVIGISGRKTKDNLRKLKNKKILKRIGPDKGGHWEIIGESEFVAFTETPSRQGVLSKGSQTAQTAQNGLVNGSKKNK